MSGEERRRRVHITVEAVADRHRRGHPALSTKRAGIRGLPRVVAIAVALLLAACGDATVAAPPSYGQGGWCYYAESPAEVAALQDAGLCPVNWAPGLMPTEWRNSYDWYYGSPVYYDRYVPSGQREAYRAKAHAYRVDHRGQVVADAPRARAKPVTSGAQGNGRRGADSPNGSFGKPGTSRSDTSRSNTSRSSGARR